MAEDFLTPEQLVKIFHKRVKKDKDVACAITGYEGEGKSTLAGWIMIEALRQLGNDDDYIAENFDNYMIYSPDRKEMFEKITRPEKYVAINSDEAVKALYKLNWASANQKFLNMLFQLCRQENKINLLCIPRFTDLNEYFRNHRVMFWIHILETGYAILLSRDWSPFSRDPWHIDENKKIIDMNRKRKAISDLNVDNKINMMSKTRNYVGIVKWDDFTPQFKKIYLAGKSKHKYDDLDMADESSIAGVGVREKKYMDSLMSVAVKLKEQGMTNKQIGLFMGVSETTVGRYLKETEISTTPTRSSNTFNDNNKKGGNISKNFVQNTED